MLSVGPKVLTMIGIISLTASCASTPPTTFYVLETQSQPVVRAAKSVKKHIIGIGPLSIPALLERKQIITHTDQNTVKIAEFHQWAAPLKDSIAQVLTQNLTALQSHNVIRAYPWSAYGPVDYRIVIDIVRFDTQPGQTANIEAQWSIINEKTQDIVTFDQLIIEHPLTDTSYQATVKALSGGLYELSHQLSRSLDQLK